MKSNRTILFVFFAAAILICCRYFYVNDRGGHLNVASESSFVELRDGDTYDLTVGYVTKIISGKEQTMLAYNGSIPGPTIRVAQEGEITINLKNNTDVATLLHAHGVRMENTFDGSPMQQKEIQPGESFRYKLKFLDPGVYWYHPHVHETYEQGLGLYGAFIVSPINANYFPPVNREVPLFLSDLPVENGKITIDKDSVSHALIGHYGNVMLLNGEEKFNLNAKAGEVVRLYVINAANARPFNFAIDGLKLKLVGADSGAYETAKFVNDVTLGPSERAIIDILMPNSGSYKIENKTSLKTYTLGNIEVTHESVSTSYEREFNALQSNSAMTKSIERFQKLFNQEPSKKILLTLGTIDMKNMDAHGDAPPNKLTSSSTIISGSSDGIEWEEGSRMANQSSDLYSTKWKIVDLDTGKENMDIDWSLKTGEPVKIRIINDPKALYPMNHPIHFHGQGFLVVARNGVKQTNLVWKDTILVKTGETVDIVLDPSNPGEWMAHCHISEHLEAGMMFTFKVQ